MRVHIHWKESKQTKHYFAGPRCFMVLELTGKDRERIAAMKPGDTTIVVADPEHWSEEKVRAVLDTIGDHLAEVPSA